MYNPKIYLIAIILFIFVSGCDQYPNIDEPGNCELYGVVETGIPLGDIRVVEAKSLNELSKICKSGWVNRTSGGCVLKNDDGTVDVYYEIDNTCLKNHELCHAHNGRKHTKLYISDVAKNHPAPACPNAL